MNDLQNQAMENMINDIKAMSLGNIAALITSDWKKPYFGAVPYINALRSLRDIHDNYGYDSGKSIVLYFLANARTWKGTIAKMVKAELNRRAKG